MEDAVTCLEILAAAEASIETQTVQML